MKLLEQLDCKITVCLIRIAPGGLQGEEQSGGEQRPHRGDEGVGIFAARNFLSYCNEFIGTL